MMFGRIGIKSMAAFCKQSAISMRAGLTVTRTLKVVTKESRDTRLRNVIEEVNADITGGDKLSEALRKRKGQFPPIFVETVSAGERGGRLDIVFARLADYFDARLRINRAVIRASIYPAIQLSFAYAVFSFIMILFASNKFAMAQYIGSISIIVFGALVLIIFLLFGTEAGRAIWDYTILWIPIVRGLTIKLSLSRFTRTLAMQLESGISMTESAERAALVAGNKKIGDNLMEIVEPLRDGMNIGEAVSNSKYVTPMIREVLAVGDETGNFSEALDRVANVYEEEAFLVLESLPKFIGPVVLVIVGAVVVFLFIKVYFGVWLGPVRDVLGV